MTAAEPPAASSCALTGNRVPLHVDLTASSPQGSVFHSVPEKLIVLRYRTESDILAMLELAELALKEAQTLRCTMLVCDLRPLGRSASSLTCTAVLLHILRLGDIRHLALLTNEKKYHPLTPEVQGALALTSTQWCFESSFESVARWFADKSAAMRDWLESRPEDFMGCYGGSTYSIPELKCTVLRMSGYNAELDLSVAFVARAREIHAALRGESFVIDTSASPPIVDLKRYSFAYQNIFLPFSTSGTLRYWVHIRSGDNLIAREAPPLELLLQSFNIQCFHVASLSASLKILNSLNGRRPT
jgi:hypothetical protein